MCRRSVLLISFVLMLILSGNIQAEDLNPPDFAGADGWCAAVWEFDVEPPEPTHFVYKPELLEPEFLIDGIVEGWWNEGAQVLDASGEGRFYLPVPKSNGGTMTMNIQITWEGGGDVWAFPEVWSAPDNEGGDYLGGNEGVDPEITNLGNGMWHGTWLGDVSSVGEYVVALIGGEGVAIHQLIVDAVVHDGGTPVGTGHRPGAPDRGPATNPIPSNEEILVERDAELSWSPGIYAATHNVYFGTNFDDVNDADSNSNLLISPGQPGTSYDSPDLLDWGRNYYWRIDEVNAPANPGIYKGKTWSFTVEPYAYDISEHIIALTTSSFDPKYEPNNIINGSGLDANDLHDVNEFNMWLSARDATEPAWIQYQFDRPYKLHELMVWNYNRFREDRLGYGFKEMVIEYSMDGTDFTALDPIQLEPATGKEPASPNVVALNGLVATHIRLRAVSNFSGRSQYGLSEVRILYLPVRAREPEPTDGAENVLPGMALNWRSGREAGTHDVLIGTDMNVLTLVGDDITETSFMPDLVLSETYYWQLLETDVAELAGDIWSFTTQDYLVVDDFESYNTTDRQIWEIWLDGLGFGMPGTPNFNPGNGTGSAVGDESSPSYMEETIVHDGSKSVPLAYNNSVVSISEITAKTSDLSIGPDWSRANIKALTLYIHGGKENLGGQLYVKLNGVRKDQSADLIGEYWQEVNIDLASFGVDLQNVTSLTIGIAGAGSSGLVYIDNIRLYPSRCIPQKVPGDLTGDCIVDEEDLAVIADNWLKKTLSVEYMFDTGFSDTSGNNRTGIGQNNPTVANGILTLNGTNFVDIPLGANNPFDGSRDFSVAMDFKTNIASILMSSARDNDRDNHSMSIFVHHWDQPYSGEVLYDNYNVGAATVEDDPVDGQWHNVVVTYDADSELFIVYLDGVAGEAVEMNPAIPGIEADTVRIGGSLNSTYPYNEDAENLFGDIDNVRIFNFTLSLEDILGLPDIPTAPVDLNGDGIVDQTDKDIVEANIGPEKLWP
jgi:hypothetical protein